MLAAMGALVVACTTPATGVICAVGTDVPADLAMEIDYAARFGAVSTIGSSAFDGRFVRAGPGIDGGVATPFSFGIVPGSMARDDVVTLVVEARTAAFVIRRTVRFSFVHGQTLTIPIFLSTACLRASATACRDTTVACTLQQACEEAGETCNENGECVGLSVTPVLDAGVHDAGDAGSVSACGIGLSCCPDAGACPAGQLCGPGNICTTSTTCSPGTVLCGTACVDLTTDPSHCGACDVVCSAGSACTGGACAASCGTCAAGDDLLRQYLRRSHARRESLRCVR